MPPSLLVQVEVEGFYRLLCGLLGGKTGPLVPACLPGDLSHLQVPFRLEKPVLSPIHPSSLP